MALITSETWTGANGAAWPAAWAAGTTGAGSSATIQGNAGRLVNGSAAAYNGGGRISRRLTTGNVADAVVLYRFRWPSATVFNNYAGFWLRSNGTNANLLDGQRGIFFNAAFDFGGWQVQAADGYNNLAGFTTILVSKTWATNTWYWVRFGVVGSLIKARVWDDGQPEPSTWQAESSQGNLLTGSGAWGYSIGQGGHPLAQTEFDDFSADTAFPSATTNYNVATTATVTAGSTVTGRVGKVGAVTASAVASSQVSAPIPKFSSLQDNFGSPDALKWDNVQGTNPTVTGGQLRITPDPGYPSTFSVNRYDFTGSAAFLQVAQYPNNGNGTVQSWPLQVRLDGANFVQWILTGNALIAEYFTGGAATVIATISDLTDYGWLRIRESGGTVFWDHSTNGNAWVNDGSAVIPWNMTQVSAYLAAGYYGTEPAPGVLVLDNFNIAPVLTGSVSQVVTAGGVVSGASGPAGAVSATVTAGGVVSGAVGKLSGVIQSVNAVSALAVGKFGAVTSNVVAGQTVSGRVDKVSGTSQVVTAGSVVTGRVGKVTGTTATVTAGSVLGIGRYATVSASIAASSVVTGSVSAPQTGVTGTVSGPVTAGAVVSGPVGKVSGVNASVSAGHMLSGVVDRTGAVSATVLAGHTVSGSVAAPGGVSSVVTAGSLVSGQVGLSGAVSGAVTAGSAVDGFLVTGPAGAVTGTVTAGATTAVRLGKTTGVNGEITASSTTVVRLGLQPEVVAGVITASADIRGSVGERGSVSAVTSAQALVTALVLTGTEAKSGFVAGGDDESFFVRENTETGNYPVVLGS